MYRLVLALVLGVVATAAACASAGRITLPARELFDFEEGTVEAWVMFEFDPAGWQEDQGVYQWRGRWFTFTAPQTNTDLGAEVVVEYGLKNHGRLGRIEPGCNFRVAFYVDGEKVPHPVLPACTKFERGTWHHFAVTWAEGRIVRAYLDGKLAQEMVFPHSVVRDVPAAAQVIIGHPDDPRWNLLALDDLRISSIARQPEELGSQAAPPQPDPYTLLLDGFEHVADRDGHMISTPAVLADAALPGEYELTGGRMIEGHSGSAWALTPADMVPAQ
ncbi:MAG TPA: LamG-like jellyroll fold domain-containing protein [Armatimonadota bacterium]|nr:LamG-like jellyroll fold domain-containing protein [Armatimonadota bacterium]